MNLKLNTETVLSFKSLLWVFLLYCSLASAAVEEQKNRVLIFASSGQPPLHASPNDGFLESITREALNRIGYELEIKIYPTERSIHNLNKGLVDGEMSRVQGLEDDYPNIRYIPEALYKAKFFIYSKNIFDFELGWSALENQKVAYIRGWKIVDSNIPQTAIVTKAKNFQQLVNLINKDRVDCFIYSGWLDSSFKKLLEQNNIKQVHPYLVERPMYMYLSKKHRSLIKPLTQAIKDMKQDGSYGVLVDKFLTPLLVHSSFDD